MCDVINLSKRSGGLCTGLALVNQRVAGLSVNSLTLVSEPCSVIILGILQRILEYLNGIFPFKMQVLPASSHISALFGAFCHCLLKRGFDLFMELTFQ